MLKNKLLLPFVVSIILCVWLSFSLVKVENERYALFVGMCYKKDTPPELRSIDFQCLSKVETRTSWVWHLFYALTS